MDEKEQNTGKPYKKKKRGIIKKILIGFGIFVGILLIAAAVIAIRHWGTIKAMYIAMTTDTAVIEEQLREKDKEFAENIKNYLSESIRDYSDEEKRQIENGEKTETQLIAEIIAEGQSERDNQGGGQSSEQRPETAEQIVARHVSNLYKCQNGFEGRVSALAASVKAYTDSYKATHPNASWRDAKIAAVTKYTPMATSIESECYKAVDEEVAELKKELKAIGADLSIVSTVQASAEQAMELKKSRIMSQYMDKMK